MKKAGDIYLPATIPLMNGMALVLWGWQCNFLIYAIPMALVLELSRIIPWKIPISDIEFNRISDLSSLIFLAAVIYIFTTRSYHGIYTILALLPFLLFLLILAQQYSVQGFIKPSALFISLRRIEAINTGTYKGIDLSYPYLFVCILSASAGNHHASIYYIFTVILISWTLWYLKPAFTRTYLWIFLVITAAVAGYGVQLEMKQLQTIAESTFLDWIDQFMWRSRDPRRTSTSIGSLGRLKLSDRIMVRVNTHGKILKEPLLLREATYINYIYGVWTNYQTTLRIIDPTADGKRWIIDNNISTPEILTISFFMDDETAIVPVPAGLGSITNVTAAQIEYSAYGALSIELNPGWIIYDAIYNKNQIYDALPTKEDLEIPSNYKDQLERLSTRLGLENLKPADKVSSLKKYFADNFEYSLTQSERYPKGRYLSKFLFERKKGHCEYFATATTLLLRAAGIPARYVVGYAIDEYSDLEGQYIGRARHAHSWAQAYVNDKWQVVDTTPPVWVPLEAKDGSVMEPLIDVWSWIIYKLVTWDKNDSKDVGNLFIWLLLPILFYYLWRIFVKDRIYFTGKRPEEIQLKAAYAGTDSAFYKLLPVLEKHFMPRKPGETLTAWIAGIERKTPELKLQELLILHYRYRFDPAGLGKDEEHKLQNGVKEQLETLN